jgi:intein/homing endonuclease
VADTRIKTEAGTKYIKDIEAGDKVFVFTTNGLELAPVKTKWMTGVKPVFKVKTKHFSVTGTDTHPILVHSKLTNVVTYVPISKLDTNIHSVVYEKNNSNIDNLISLIDFRTNVVILKNPEIWSSLDTKGKEDIIINTASDLDIKKSSVRNFLYGQQYIDEVTAFSILETLSLKDQAVLETQKQYYSQNQINLPKYIDEDFAELFGFLIGDGCISDNTITFAEGTDPAQNQYYANLLTRYFGDCKRQNSNTRTYSNWTVSSTLGSKLLQDLGYIRGAKNKRIPEWVFLASDNVKSAFIRGLANADGHIIDDELSGKWHCEIELCNKRLVEDIKDLWTDLGMCSGQIRYRQRKASTIQGHDVVATESWTVFLSNNQIPSFEKISSVDYVGEEEVYDIEVDHEKHNFIANGIVVHNSRAPERRIFYIDVGNLPKPKAEQYMNEIMTKFKNKLVYDATTGEIRDDRKFMCYALDTKIPLLDGRTLTISDIIEEYNNGKTNWVYSCDPVTGKFVPGPISWAGITKHNSDVVRVTFDNGKSVICTPDHKFPVWGKGFIEAQNLSIGESLIPGYRRTKEISTDGVEYEQIFKNDTKTWEFTHREVARYKKDIGLEENLVHYKKYLDNKKSVIHHKDFDRYNNNPENLVMMNHKDIFDAVDYRNNIKRDYGSVGYHAELLNNHKVISVERLDEKMTVAALTIDQEETYHSHHTYLLDAGVYTKNTMLEDFWLPRREGGRGTEISTLPAGQNLGELADVEYFQRLLYKSLNVPSGRLDSNQTFNLGRGAEISRDEDKFSDFVTRLRLEFSLLFKDALERQLILKNVIKVNEWDDNVQSIHVRYADNSYYAEIRENEIINMRAETLAQLDDYVGVYFSRNWVMKKVLHMTEDDIKLMQQEIDAERSSENERNLGNSLDNLNIQTIVHKKAQEDGVVIDPNSGEVMPPQMIPPPPEPPDPAKTNNTPKK